MLAAVRGLVEAEHRSAALADTLAAAERLARGDGDGLLQRIVSHFQQLFAVPSIEGVLTAINQVIADQAEGATQCCSVQPECILSTDNPWSVATAMHV